MMDSDIRPHRTGNTLGSSSSSSSELFICFTSRLSSSSMKISSKSILSPGRGRDQQPLSLSNSLSRRLRTNGSMKGGQASPMFPTGGGGKKRGCAFENPEPSSPKVTCIGQVRVKTKKQGKKMRTMSSKRRSSGGDLSFRKVEQSQMSSRDGLYQSNASNNNQEGGGLNQQRNQRWVHLPLTICEALRAFGAEFSCLFPCKSPCFSSSDHQRGEKEDKSASSAAAAGGESGGGQSSCGAVFARWLVAVQDGGGKEREIELVVGGGGEEESTMVRSQRSTFLSRHVEEEEEEDDLQWGERGEEEEVEAEEEEEEEEEARVSICIPPKNALLLMRCRSDPVQMSALANRLWESPVRNHEEQDEDEDEEVDNDNHEDKHNNGDDEEEEQVLMNVVEESEVKEELRSLEEVKGCEELISNEDLDHEQENPETESPETDTNLPLEVQEEAHEEEEEEEEEEEIRKEEELEIEEKQEDEVVVVVVVDEEEVAHHTVDDIDSEAILDDQIKKLENEEDEAELVEEQESSHCSSVVDYSVHSDLDVEEDKALLILEAALEEETEKSTEDHERETPAQEDTLLEDADDEEKVTVLVERVEQETHEEEEPHSEVIERESHDDEVVVVVKKEEERESSVLPDCLLLMMCEPKLSMEVSKETWVCSTDFIRWLPERHVTTKDGVDHHDHDHDEPNKKTVISTDQDYSNPTHHNSHHQQLHLPPRSSCSFPAPAAGVSMAAMIEQKLVNSVAYEPFVLTRCKSEPMRTAAKLAPEACFWKNRKLEPHRNATFGIGAAGVGF